MSTATDDTTFDAIVIGSGISGGWAAKELCEKGLKTLVLERGRNVTHIKDYPTANLAPVGAAAPRRHAAQADRREPAHQQGSGYGEDNAHFFVKDADHPYVQEKPFDWIRGYQVGGKSLIWGRACQRWSKYEFTAPERQGYGINWPIGYDDVAPWYSHVERFIGVMRHARRARGDARRRVPAAVRVQLRRAAPAATSSARTTATATWCRAAGRTSRSRRRSTCSRARGTCQARNLCMRGCPLRRLLQLELVDAALGGEDGQPDDPSRLGRAFHPLRRGARARRRACA